MGYLESISLHRIAPREVSGSDTVADLIDHAFSAYNAGRLRELCTVFTRKFLEPDCTVGLTLSGALTPAGLGMSCLIPLIQSGFVDWIVSTGANLYHDTHFALGFDLHQSRPGLDDLELRRQNIIRIYDVVFHYDTLLGTDIQGDPALFGEAAGLVRSQALLRLSFSRSAPLGLMCIGTRTADTFQPGLGTELLTFLARTLEITIAQWLDRAR